MKPDTVQNVCIWLYKRSKYSYLNNWLPAGEYRLNKEDIQYVRTNHTLIKRYIGMYEMGGVTLNELLLYST